MFTMEKSSSSSQSSTSGAAILSALIPALVTALLYLGIFSLIRKHFPKFYVPRTFLPVIPEPHRTPYAGSSWWTDLWRLPDSFVLQHHSLDAWLYLRFLRFIVTTCFLAACITWPILFPINASGGGGQTQLDRISFSNIARNDYLWAHVAVAWVLFLGFVVMVAYERLQLVGIRQAYLLDDARAKRLSSRTVLFLNAPPEACRPENREEYFGSAAERIWPVPDTGDLDKLVAARTSAALALEETQMDVIVATVKHSQRSASTGTGGSAETQALLPPSKRPIKRSPPLIGTAFDPDEKARKDIKDGDARIAATLSSPARNVPRHGAVFVSFTSQKAAHQAFQMISFPPRMPVKDRFLGVTPKEVLWHNLAMSVKKRLSKASLALTFVVVFTIFFSIPVGLLGTISNVQYLADRVSWLRWLHDLPAPVMGLLTGFVPPAVTSWFVSFVPKLFRHIAKMAGEPTAPQAELKTQAWFFGFQVVQVFLVTTFSSGAAAVVVQAIRDPPHIPDLLASSLPKASNFYLTYFILQGLGSASQTIVNLSDLSEYLFYEYYWDKTPRQKFQTYADVKGTPWAQWYPKFANFVVIALAYACVAPLVLGFATVGVAIYYLAYRHQLLYATNMKVDTRGESYQRALQQTLTGVYLAQLSLIGLLSARRALIPALLIILLLILTATFHLLLNRILRPLELYLGLDSWHDMAPPLTRPNDVPPEDIAPDDDDDDAAAQAATDARRLGIGRLPGPAPRVLSQLFDRIITRQRARVEAYLADVPSDPDSSPSAEDDLARVYQDPARTASTPLLWLPRDRLGASRREMQRNEAEGLRTTDEAAELDDEGRLRWDRRLENAPVWSAPKTV